MKISNALRRTACVLALSACASGTVLAKESGFYLGVNAGQSDFDVADDGIGLFNTRDETKTEHVDQSFALVAGYRFNPYIGLELSLHRLGEVEVIERGTGLTAPASTASGIARAKAGVTGPALALVGTLPVGNFEFFGKVGAMYADTKLSLEIDSTFGTLPSSITGVNITSTETTEAMYGIGIGYAAGEDLFLKLEWTRVANVGDEDELGTEEINVDVVSIGFQYRF